MEAVRYISTISASLVGIIAVGGAFTCGYHAVKMIQADDEYGVARAKKNIKKTLMGIVMGITISGLINYIFSII